MTYVVCAVANLPKQPISPPKSRPEEGWPESCRATKDMFVETATAAEAVATGLTAYGAEIAEVMTTASKQPACIKAS
jgi:hypothetical protein